MLRYIEETFDVTRGKNLFEFPYDWRRDNRVAARRLQRAERASGCRTGAQSSGAADAKLVLVGHSMGGLISRYFLECLDGWRDTRTLVTFGTPYRGLRERARHARERQEDRVLRPHRAGALVHRDLPAAADLSLLRRRQRRPSPDSTRRTSRSSTAAKARRRSTSTARSQPRSRSTARIPPTATSATTSPASSGFKQPTNQSAVRDGDRVKLLQTIGGEDPGGDGTVPRPSATPLEFEDDQGATFSAERHASLQNDDHLLLQLTGVLTGNTIDWSKFKDADPDGRPLARRRGRLLADGAGSRPGAARARGRDALVAVAVDIETGEVSARQTLDPGDEGWHEAELGPLPAGRLPRDRVRRGAGRAGHGPRHACWRDRAWSAAGRSSSASTSTVSAATRRSSRPSATPWRSAAGSSTTAGPKKLAEDRVTLLSGGGTPRRRADGGSTQRHGRGRAARDEGQHLQGDQRADDEERRPRRGALVLLQRARAHRGMGEPGGERARLPGRRPEPSVPDTRRAVARGVLRDDAVQGPVLLHRRLPQSHRPDRRRDRSRGRSRAGATRARTPVAAVHPLRDLARDDDRGRSLAAANRARSRDCCWHGLAGEGAAKAWSWERRRYEVRWERLAGYVKATMENRLGDPGQLRGSAGRRHARAWRVGIATRSWRSASPRPSSPSS